MTKDPESPSIKLSFAPRVAQCLMLATLTLIAAQQLACAQTDGNWQQKLGTFRVGVVGGNRPILKRRQVQPFREELQKALGIPVEILPARDHQALIDALAGSRIEYATLSATAFSAAWRACKCIEPVAVPMASDGSSSFRSVLISRYLGPGSLAALKKKDILIPGKNSFAGFLYPKGALISEGVKLDTPEWPVDDKGTVRATIHAFSKGEGDAILGWTPVVREGEAKRGLLHDLTTSADRSSSRLRTLWQSDPIPHGPHVVRRNLPREIKDWVWRALQGIHERNPKAYDAIEPNLGGGFRQIDIGDYEPLSKILSKSSLPKASN